MSRRPPAVIVIAAVLYLAAGLLLAGSAAPAAIGSAQDLDARVRAFLSQNSRNWHDMNVPESDGELLHDLIVKGKYTRALEIGTSTGRSGIWQGLALSKTGGKLITIDIDEGRHRQAVANFKAAGVEAFIDARLGDAHDLVPALAGPFDFVFIDADKDWYTNYAKAVLPKLTVGGCLTAHNVSPGRGWGRGGGMTGGFYGYVSGLQYMETSVTSGGVLIAYKRK